MIEMRDLSKSYIERNGEERRVFEDLGFCPKKEERAIAITGRSGSGKTTLLKIIAGLDVQYGGGYWLDGRLQEKSLRAMAKVRREQIGVVPQDGMLLGDRSVIENVKIAVPPKYDKTAVAAECLERTGLRGREGASARKLSGGEAQRVAIARAMAKSPKLLLADEPTASLDEKTEGDILALFEALIGEGTMVIVATHNEAVASWCDSRYRIEGRRLVRV